MKIAHLIIMKLLCLVALVAGLLVVAMWFRPALAAAVGSAVREDLWRPFGGVTGLVLFVLGLLGVWPLSREKRKNTISFPGTHGDVTIQLDSVEATLGRVVSKMPEVKKISVRVTPSEDNHRAEVTADVWMYKGADPASARELANRISDRLADTAVNILGVEDITTVNLNVRGVIVSPAAPAPDAAGAVPSVPPPETVTEAAAGRTLYDFSAEHPAEQPASGASEPMPPVTGEAAAGEAVADVEAPTVEGQSPEPETDHQDDTKNSPDPWAEGGN